MFKFLVLFSLLLSLPATLRAQNSSQQYDSLIRQVLALQSDVDEIKLNLAKSESRLKRGIFISAVGYSTVIAGGLMLGRKQDDLGKTLLVTGGVTGVVGTAVLVDAFRFLGRPHRSSRK